MKKRFGYCRFFIIFATITENKYKKQTIYEVYQLNGSAPAIAALSSGGCMGDAVQTNRKEYQTTRIQRQVLRHHKVWRKHKG